MTVLLIHSPLLGPSSWRHAAAALDDLGASAIVPDLTAATTGTHGWSSAIASGTAAVCPSDGELIVVGHSGAGHYLPLIGHTLGMHRCGFVFVDAVVPPPSGSIVPERAMTELLDAHTDDGLLEPWLSWWPPETVDRILPSAEHRTALRADQPVVPRSLYGEAIPIPSGWMERPLRYIRTSAAYEPEYDLAAEPPWTRDRIDGTHLSIVTQPVDVARAIVGAPSRA